MTVWVTEQLIKVGVPEDAVLWNVTESGEEVDLLVGFLVHFQDWFYGEC